MNQNLKRDILDLDGELAKVLINLETLGDLHKELTKVWQELTLIDNRVFRESVLLKLLNELLYYTVNDLREHHRRMEKGIKRLYDNIKDMS